MASHAFPYQWLLYLDKIGVLLVAARALREHALIRARPRLFMPLIALAAGLNLFDANMARRHGVTWPHVLWHLSSALISFVFLYNLY
jgi:hypothetical protein